MNARIVPERTAPVNSPASETGGGENTAPLYTQPDDTRIILLDDTKATSDTFFATLSGQMVAYGLGRKDAEDGLGAAPEMYFTRRHMQEYYCKGYAAVAGHNLTTLFFLGKPK